MNTDCKMYTNLVNSRLAPWAVAKIHMDQKGFIPGRYITEHTRLASEVSHLSNSFDIDGYIVSLDQAKAYDRTDLPWLISVLSAMNIDAHLVALIKDIVFGCKSKVRINSGYSPRFSLSRGVRQGDPLSCLLYDFSIEPLGHRLRNKIRGISVLGLPPTKLMMYADDTNLFLSALDDELPVINECLKSTSYTIGCKFNLDKTDVLPIGSIAHRTLAHENGVGLPSAFTLAPGSALRVLGVWIGSTDEAAPRWKQILSHNRRLIAQWSAIGVSARNRALIAKALLLSRCYYLLDGNGMPSSILHKMSAAINRYVRGKFSSMPYSFLSAPISEGGLDCPSLVQEKLLMTLNF